MTKRVKLCIITLLSSLISVEFSDKAQAAALYDTSLSLSLTSPMAEVNAFGFATFPIGFDGDQDTFVDPDGSALAGFTKGSSSNSFLNGRSVRSIKGLKAVGEASAGTNGYGFAKSLSQGTQAFNLLNFTGQCDVCGPARVLNTTFDLSYDVNLKTMIDNPILDGALANFAIYVGTEKIFEKVITNGENFQDKGMLGIPITLNPNQLRKLAITFIIGGEAISFSPPPPLTKPVDVLEPVTPVPEPSYILGTLAFGAFGAVLKRKRKLSKSTAKETAKIC